jgi:hypothetical protein
MIGIRKTSIVVSLLMVAMVGEVFSSPVPAGDSNTVGLPPFPYVAEITADNVNVRSGPGTNYYACGKLKQNDRVTVVGSQFSWSCVVPPPGNFSWISRRYVKISDDNANVGIVTDEARVYVGTEDLDPIRSTRTQFKLNKDDRVQLLGELKSDYYKIAPPTGAYRWISTRFTKPMISGVVIPPVPDPPVVIDINSVVVPTAPTPPTIPAPNVAPVPGDPSFMEQFNTLRAQLDVERKKPLEEQNYDEIEKSLRELSEKEAAGKAARYAQHALKLVDRFKLAFSITREDALGDESLKEIRENIAAAREARLAELKQVGKYAAVGKLRASNIYGSGSDSRLYRVVGENNRIVCYAAPLTVVDLKRFIGKKVGLIGQIVPHPQTAGALVRFSQIVVLD